MLLKLCKIYKKTLGICDTGVSVNFAELYKTLHDDFFLVISI